MQGDCEMIVSVLPFKYFSASSLTTQFVSSFLDTAWWQFGLWHFGLSDAGLKFSMVQLY